MARTVGMGIQNFAKLIENRYFYVDKTDFIREWWERGDVTLLTRPRRFGKTLNMNMLERFFPSNTQGGEKYLRGWPYGKRRRIVDFRELIL